MLWLKTRRS